MARPLIPYAHGSEGAGVPSLRRRVFRVVIRLENCWHGDERDYSLDFHRDDDEIICIAQTIQALTEEQRSRIIAIGVL